MTGGAPAASAPLDELRGVEALFFVEDLDHPRLSGEDRHHLVDVLRPRAGTRVALGDGRGSFRCAVVGELSERRAPRRRPGEPPLELEAATGRLSPPAPALTVAFAVPKGDRYELVVQKLTELGVDVLVPLVTRRSVARPAPDAAGRRHERLARVAREASSQARRLHLPEIVSPIDLPEFVVGAPGVLAFAEPGGGPLDAGTTCVVVGPEGGFAPGEIPPGAARVGLGPTILRAETAAIAAGALLCSVRAGTVRPGG